MYETVQTGNTYSSINDCLGYLFRRERPLRETLYRVSLVWRWEDRLFCVGDDLELVTSDGKTVKKRWWQQNDINQRRLPFLLYHPATIVSLVVSRNGGGWRDNTFALKFAYGDEHLVVEHGGAYHHIEAIRVHRIVASEAICVADREISADMVVSVPTAVHHVYTPPQAEDRIHRVRAPWRLR